MMLKFLNKVEMKPNKKNVKNIRSHSSARFCFKLSGNSN